MAFFPAHATDLSWSVAVARAVELSPAAVAFAVLSSDAADPAVEFAPFASDVAVEFVDAADAAFDDDPEAVEVAFEASTAVEDAWAPLPGADAVAVESFAPELAAAPVGLPVVEVAVLLPDALAEAGPPEEVDDAVDGVAGFSSVPPPAWAPAMDGLPSSSVPAAAALPAPVPIEPAPAAAVPLGCGPRTSRNWAEADVLVSPVAACPVAVPGAVEVDAVAEGEVVPPSPLEPAAAEADALAGVVPVAGV